MGYMGYRVDSWETDFRISADKIAAVLAEVNADPALTRPCWNRAHNINGDVIEPHDCQRTKLFKLLTDVVEELTGFHDCEEGIDGFRLGYHLDNKWHPITDDVLNVLGRYADEGSFARFSADSQLFGYRVIDGKLHTESAVVTWSVP